MNLQDVILFVLSLIVSSSLIPSILGPNKPAQSTAIFSAVSLSAMGVILYTMQLTMTSTAAFIGAVLWSVLIAQTARVKK